ncbi:MAG: galactokinase [Synergistaceae bacterium]|nr:galactokinase [Synergistaceae bacterium]
MICTFELNDEETKFVEDYMRVFGETSLADMAKRFLLEDVADSRAADAAWKEYEEDPVTYSHEEVGRMLGIFSEMEEVYAKVFGSECEAEKFFSPGRVNLIGEHTDHEGGYVFPCAITFGIYALAAKRPGNTLRMYSMNFDSESDSAFEIAFDDVHEKLTGSRSWVNYPLGIVSTLKKHGYNFDSGIDILYSGNLPDGAGLSSSAAIEVLTAKIFSELLALNIDGVKAALYSQEAENNFVGMHCGIMDQFAVSMARKNHAVLLNCSTLDYSHIPLELGDSRIIITNSNVPHSLVGSEYNLRREQCESALNDIRKVKDISCLCDLSPDEFMKVSGAIHDPVTLKRARHAVYENARALKAADALKAGDLITFGKLMNDSHVSLRDDYEVTVPEIDTLVNLEWNTPGVLGSRMTGGGFGGCTVSIVKNDAIDSFIQNVGAEYTRLTGRTASFYTVDTSDGAGRI